MFSDTAIVKSVAVVHVQHDVHVGAAVADVDRAVGRDTQACLQLFDDRDLAVARRHADDRLHFARVRVVFELGSEDVIGGATMPASAD